MISAHDDSQNLMVCYLYNASNTTVSISGSIFNHFTGLVPPTYNGCVPAFVMLPLRLVHVPVGA